MTDQPTKHVDDMTPEERYQFRLRQLAELVVLAQREGLAAAGERLASYCDTSTKELALLAIDQLALVGVER